MSASLADESQSGRTADELVGVTEHVEEDALPREFVRVEPDEEIEVRMRLHFLSHIHGG